MCSHSGTPFWPPILQLHRIVEDSKAKGIGHCQSVTYTVSITPRTVLSPPRSLHMRLPLTPNGCSRGSVTDTQLTCIRPRKHKSPESYFAPVEVETSSTNRLPPDRQSVNHQPLQTQRRHFTGCHLFHHHYFPRMNTVSF